MSVYIHKSAINKIYSADVIEHEEKYYVRVSDVAHVLGAKQPFTFSSDIVKYFEGNHVIKTGVATEPFRRPDDNARTPYIEVSNIVYYLQTAKMGQPLSANNKRRLIAELEAYL